MSTANTNPSHVPDSQPREVMNVAVLAESELGSEAQRERRKRILDATMAIASKGGYEAVQMRAVADRERLDVDQIGRVASLGTMLRRRFDGRYPIDPFGFDPQIVDLVTPVFEAAVRVEIEDGHYSVRLSKR